MHAKPKDSVIVASEKADFIADRIAAGTPAPELEMRKLARYLREIAAGMDRPRAVRVAQNAPASSPRQVS